MRGGGVARRAIANGRDREGGRTQPARAGRPAQWDYPASPVYSTSPHDHCVRTCLPSRSACANAEAPLSPSSCFRVGCASSGRHPGRSLGWRRPRFQRPALSRRELDCTQLVATLIQSIDEYDRQGPAINALLLNTDARASPRVDRRFAIGVMTVRCTAFTMIVKENGDVESPRTPDRAHFVA